MPFTPAHTAIVLPVLRSRFVSATGLIIGSLAPDFEYFFKMSVDGIHGHTWAGLFYFDLPVTIALSFVFHQIVKVNLILSLPRFLRERFTETLLFKFRHGLIKRPYIFIASALVGSASHILWDGFTHGNGFFVRALLFYDGAFVPFMGVKYPLWYALQHISTVIGLVFVFIYILSKDKTLAVPPRLSGSYWVVFFSIVTGITALRFMIYSADYNLGNLVVSIMTAVCVACIACGLIRFPGNTSSNQESLSA